MPKRYLMDSQIAWKMHACTRFKFFFVTPKMIKKMFFGSTQRRGNILILILMYDYVFVRRRRTCNTFPLFIWAGVPFFVA